VREPPPPPGARLPSPPVTPATPGESLLPQPAQALAAGGTLIAETARCRLCSIFAAIFCWQRAGGRWTCYVRRVLAERKERRNGNNVLCAILLQRRTTTGLRPVAPFSALLLWQAAFCASAGPGAPAHGLAAAFTACCCTAQGREGTHQQRLSASDPRPGNAGRIRRLCSVAAASSMRCPDGTGLSCGGVAGGQSMTGGCGTTAGRVGGACGPGDA